MSDLRSVQFDVRDGDDEVVSTASDIYINIRLSINGKVSVLFCIIVILLMHFLSVSEYGEFTND